MSRDAGKIADVTREKERIDEMLAQLDDEVDLLKERLVPVLAPAGVATSADENTAKAAHMAPLAWDLHKTGDRVLDIIKRVQGIIELLEI